MNASDLHETPVVDAYANNLLIDGCGPILSRTEIARRLLHRPPAPTPRSIGAPREVVEHEMTNLWRLHVPTVAGIELAQSIDVLLRQGYVHRNPSRPRTWSRIYMQDSADDHCPVQLAACVVGLSGAGKTSALERALSLKPRVVVQERFPHLMGPVRQLLWLKVDVPGSGRIADLVESLSRATDAALGTDYTAKILSGRSRRGAAMAHEWLARMTCHFPGLIVLDELQNLFKIETKAARRRISSAADRPLLRIVDDETLKFILTLTNTTKIPFIGCGTPDGIAAFGTRMSTAQRLLTGGYHRIDPDPSPSGGFFRRRLLKCLAEYQWLPGKLEMNDRVVEEIYRLTAGVPRICVMLWIHGQRRALATKASALSLEHLQHAAANALAPLQPAVEALLSQHPDRLARYEDLLPRGFG
jgi:hypothetical protein